MRRGLTALYMFELTSMREVYEIFDSWAAQIDAKAQRVRTRPQTCRPSSSPVFTSSGLVQSSSVEAATGRLLFVDCVLGGISGPHPDLAKDKISREDM